MGRRATANLRFSGNPYPRNYQENKDRYHDAGLNLTDARRGKGAKSIVCSYYKLGGVKQIDGKGERFRGEDSVFGKCDEI